jgi:predicted LPLAT superfamily acyltransferase
VCALIPTYRNAATVADVVRRARPHVDEVFVVDDGSGDATGDEARRAGARVVTHAFNRGKGAALATGLLRAWQAGYTHAVALDADGQHFPEDIPALLDAARAAPEAVVVGARPLGGTANVPSASRFGRAFSNFWVRVEGGVRVDDSQSGFRVYPVAPVFALPVRARRYDWEVEVLVRAAWAGIPVLSVPIRVHYPPAAERVSHFDLWRDNVRISWLNVRLLLTLLVTPRLWLRRGTRRAAPAETRWTGRSFGGRLGYRIWSGGVRWLGMPLVRFIMLFVVAYYFLFARAARAASRDYLARVLGRPAGGRAVYRHLYAFAAAIADKLLLLVRGPGSFRFHGGEAVGAQLDAARAAGRGVVLLTAHAGSWEVASARLAVQLPDLPVHLVMFRGEERRLAEFLDRLGEGVPRPDVIAVGEDELTPVRLLDVLRRGECLAMMGDRFLVSAAAAAAAATAPAVRSASARSGPARAARGVVRVPFLGADAAFPTAPYALAALSGAAVLPVFAFLERSRVYQLEAGPARSFRFEDRSGRGAVLRDGAAWYAGVVEAHLRRHPYQWYNFYRFWDADAPRPAQAAPP